MAHVLLEAALIVLLAATLIAGNIRDQCSLSVSHIVAPIADVPLLIVFVKVFTLSMPLILLPLSDVKLLVVIEALAIFAIA